MSRPTNRVKAITKKLNARPYGRSFLTEAEWAEVDRWYQHGGNMTQLFNALPGPKHKNARSFMGGYLQWYDKHHTSSSTKATSKKKKSTNGKE